MLRQFQFQTRQVLRASCRYNSTTPGTPPLLTKIRTDLKTAMRAKDTARLNTLRAIISEVNNASKTPTPVQTDLQLLSLLRKRSSSLENSKKEFSAAGREDLTTKTQEEIDILTSYAGDVKTTSAEDIESAVNLTIESFKSKGEAPKVGTIMKALFAEGGALQGQPAEMGTVAKTVAKCLVGK